MQLLKNIVTHSANPNSLGSKLRQKGPAILENLIEPIPKPIKIVDLGDSERFWKRANFDERENLNIKLLNLTTFPTAYTNMTSVVGVATDLSQYPDNSFDLVFSNAVTEHLNTKENQIKMAKETQRVGEYYCIQTLNKYFVIEPHYVLTLFQFLLKNL